MSLLVISRSDDADPGCRQAEDDLAFLAAAVGHDVLVTPHLYHQGADSPVWARLAAVAAQQPAPAVVVAAWLHPRPLRTLLGVRGAWGAGHHAVDLGSAPASALWEGIAPLLGAPAAAGGTSEIPADPARAWYPLVDPERCTQCNECHQFCLFGVYELDAAGALAVAHPERCKPGCPACARICPHSAIMFPLYGRDPAIAGAPGRLVAPEAAAAAWAQRQACTRPPPPGGSDDGLDDLIAGLDARQRERDRGR